MSQCFSPRLSYWWCHRAGKTSVCSKVLTKIPLFSEHNTTDFTLIHILIIQVVNCYIYIAAWVTYALLCFASVFRKRFFAILHTNMGVAKSTSYVEWILHNKPITKSIPIRIVHSQHIIRALHWQHFVYVWNSANSGVITVAWKSFPNKVQVPLVIALVKRIVWDWIAKCCILEPSPRNESRQKDDLINAQGHTKSFLSAHYQFEGN